MLAGPEIRMCHTPYESGHTLWGPLSLLPQLFFTPTLTPSFSTRLPAFPYTRGFCTTERCRDRTNYWLVPTAMEKMTLVDLAISNHLSLPTTWDWRSLTREVSAQKVVAWLLER